MASGALTASVRKLFICGSYSGSMNQPLNLLRALSIAFVPVAALTSASILAPAPADAHGTGAFPDRPQVSRTSFIKAMLDNHNAERIRMGLPVLAWDEGLARDATVWAAEMAETDNFDHDEESQAAENQGENLWMGTRGAYSLAEMVDGWVEEGQYYQAGRVFPQVSRTGKWEDVSHYTQVIWKDTRHVGCALSKNAQWEYLVCRYDPPGNYEGEIAERGGGSGVQMAGL